MKSAVCMICHFVGYAYEWIYAVQVQYITWCCFVYWRWSDDIKLQWLCRSNVIRHRLRHSARSSRRLTTFTQKSSSQYSQLHRADNSEISWWKTRILQVCFTTEFTLRTVTGSVLFHWHYPCISVLSLISKQKNVFASSWTCPLSMGNAHHQFLRTFVGWEWVDYDTCTYLLIIFIPLVVSLTRYISIWPTLSLKKSEKAFLSQHLAVSPSFYNQLLHLFIAIAVSSEIWMISDLIVSSWASCILSMCVINSMLIYVYVWLRSYVVYCVTVHCWIIYENYLR